MNEISLVGIDLAKNVFQVCCMDARGNVVLEKRLRRAGVTTFFGKLARCVVAMEACGGAHDWGRRARAMGHEVRLIHPRRVAAFVGAHKNDRVDARAICEAARQPSTRFVPVKTVAQQELQSLTRLRDGLIKQRTASINRLRGILCEFGVVFPKSAQAFCRRFAAWREQAAGAPALSETFWQVLDDEHEQLRRLTRRIDSLERSLRRVVAADDQAWRLMTVPGLGPVNSAGLSAAAPDPELFESGRHFSAWIGIVPRQQTTGGRTRLLGITKHGNSALRSCLVHGARSLIRAALAAEAPRNHLEAWIRRRHASLHPNVLAVAVANKLARIAWVLLVRKQTFVAWPA